MQKIIFTLLFILIVAFVTCGSSTALTIKTSPVKMSYAGIDSHQHSLSWDNTGTVSRKNSSNAKIVSLTRLRVTGTSPVNNAMNVRTTKLIVIKFNRIIKNPNSKLILLRNSRGVFLPLTYTTKYNEIFIDHSPLKSHTTYTLTLKRGSVKDRWGNMLNSIYTTKFKTGTTDLLNYHAKLVIPKLGVSPNIYTDSPSHYNAVYHYPNSAYFGTPGQCVFLGHRTTYSAILRYINLLNLGDTIIIKDYTDQKKSTYKVLYHNILYNYQLKSHFRHHGESVLILKSCYPVGYSYMKWVVHAILVSTVPLGVKA